MTSGKNPTLYLRSVEEGEIRCRLVAKGEKAVDQARKLLGLRLLADQAVITRSGVHVGYLVGSPADIHRILTAHKQLQEDYKESAAPEDHPPEVLMELVFLETPS